MAVKAKRIPLLADQYAALTRTARIVQKTTKAPIDITGWQSRFAVQRNRQLIYEATTDDGYITVDGPNGRLLLYIPSTVIVEAGDFDYDWRIWFDVPSAFYVIHGPLTVEARVPLQVPS